MDGHQPPRSTQRRAAAHHRSPDWKWGLQLGGTVIIEQIYGWPGLGWLALQAINNRDYPLIQGIALLAALFVTMSESARGVCVRFAGPPNPADRCGVGKGAQRDCGG